MELRVNARYDTDGSYFGAHAGLGYLADLNEQLELDIYGKWPYTHQKGENVTLPTGDPIRFDDLDSNRVRLGGRLSIEATENVKPYVGAAWEH